MLQENMKSMETDPYKILDVYPDATLAEIKSAYRNLVKLHHPDAGGDEEKILALNAAWEVLRDPDQRKVYDDSKQQIHASTNEAKERGERNARATAAAKAAQGQVAAEGDELLHWLQKVYVPIDRFLGQVINPFPKELKSLSADPYDDSLMEAFCLYLQHSQKLLQKVDLIYRSTATPSSAQGFGLSLYQCLSQVEDAVNELERYTMGYVDSYLHDGREMLREAKQKRLQLHKEHNRLKLS